MTISWRPSAADRTPMLSSAEKSSCACPEFRRGAETQAEQGDQKEYVPVHLVPVQVPATFAGEP